MPVTEALVTPSMTIALTRMHRKAQRNGAAALRHLGGGGAKRAVARALAALAAKHGAIVSKRWLCQRQWPWRGVAWRQLCSVCAEISYNLWLAAARRGGWLRLVAG